MLNKTKKFVKEHKTEIVLGIVVVGEIVLLEKKLDDMQNKIRDNKFEILDIKESLEK